MRARGGKHKWCKLDVTPILEKGVPVKMVGVISDVNDLKKQSEEWKQRAKLDLFTGLLNKESVLEAIGKHIGVEDRRYVLLLADLDNFKEVNDRYGHLVGDDAIREFARLLRELFPQDIVGRFGGDEFIILLENLSCEEAKRKISALCEIGVKLSSFPELKFSQSVGAVVFKGGKTDFEKLLSRADRALYLSKRRKNTYTVLDYDAREDCGELPR